MVTHQAQGPKQSILMPRGKNQLRRADRTPTMRAINDPTWKPHLTDLDPRLNAYRPDLADAALKGRVEASAYRVGKPRRVLSGRLALMTTPDGNSRMGSELLFGEKVTIFDTRDGWAWLQSREDNYVGYVRADKLGEPTEEPTHHVSALRTFLYAQADLKSPVLDTLSMNSPLSVQARDKGFAKLATGGWVWDGHIASSGDYEDDHVCVAHKFLETPYLWGGRSSVGLDCSGLVQMALARCGKQAPRDSDMQAGIGAPVPFDGDEAVLNHGDLVFWPGHVGIWLERGEFIHANATDMKVAKGSFAAIASQIKSATGDEVTAVRRI
jgi:cell wall-associated NlpC family hydrolase